MEIPNILIANLKRRNIPAYYFKGREEALSNLLQMIPLYSTVGFSGSQTLEEIGLIGLLEGRGNKVFNPYKTGLTKEESMKLKEDGARADYYLVSANAVSQDGELVFLSAFGNRTAGVSYAKNSFVICGINKIAKDLDAAIMRARNIATPLNCKRLKWDTPCLKEGSCKKEICYFPEYKRMCCQLLIIEAEAIRDRLKFILIGEDLGY